MSNPDGSSGRIEDATGQSLLAELWQKPIGRRPVVKAGLASAAARPVPGSTPADTQPRAARDGTGIVNLSERRAQEYPDVRLGCLTPASAMSTLRQLSTPTANPYDRSSRACLHGRVDSRTSY
jgi:hypothetical protein